MRGMNDAQEERGRGRAVLMPEDRPAATSHSFLQGRYLMYGSCYSGRSIQRSPFKLDRAQ